MGTWPLALQVAPPSKSQSFLLSSGGGQWRTLTSREFSGYDSHVVPNAYYASANYDGPDSPEAFTSQRLWLGLRSKRFARWPLVTCKSGDVATGHCAIIPRKGGLNSAVHRSAPWSSAKADSRVPGLRLYTVEEIALPTRGPWEKLGSNLNGGVYAKENDLGDGLTLDAALKVAGTLGGVLGLQVYDAAENVREIFNNYRGRLQ